MLGGFIFLIMLGFPIAFTLMGMAVGFGYYAYFDWERFIRRMDRIAGDDPGVLDTLASWSDAVVGNRIFDLLVNQTFSVMANDALTAVPLFLFMGSIVERSNIIGRLFATLNIAPRHFPASTARAAPTPSALVPTPTG